MKTIFAAVSVLACVVGSTDGFARGKIAHAAGVARASSFGPASVFVRPAPRIDHAPESYGFNRGYYGGGDHGWHGGPSFFRGGDVN